VLSGANNDKTGDASSPITPLKALDNESNAGREHEGHDEADRNCDEIPIPRYRLINVS
jgi:hypothetical protein